MHRCEVCANLQPDTVQDHASENRSIIFASKADLKSRAFAVPSCPECALIWNAWTRFKPSGNERDDELIEIVIAARMPLLVSSRQDSMQIEIFSGWKDEHILTEQGNDPIFLGRAVPVAKHSASKTCFELIRKWLHDCETSHAACTRQRASTSPTRLLEVGLDVTKDPRLVETNGISVQYVALSYCWGKDGTHVLKTTPQTLDQHRSSVPVNSMPKTLQDAVKITRSLGLKYLWVDALCIIQGDEDDWNRESAQMCKTYLNAHLTISADNASASDCGIFNEQTYGAMCEPIRYRGGKTVFARKALAKEHSRYHNIMRLPVPEPINRRAWTLQEALLSNRILRYTSNELVWECNQGWFCECGYDANIGMEDEHNDNVFRDIAAFGSLQAQEIYDQWDYIAVLFTERSLGKDKDKLPALSGLANQFAAALQRALPPGSEVQYLAGLWRTDLIRSLRWYVEDDYLRDTRDEGIVYRRPKVWRAPSWSWASVEGPIVLEPLQNFTTRVEILEASTLPSTVDPYGQVSSGKIIVQGRVLHDLQLDIRPWEDRRGMNGFAGFTLQKRYMIIHGGRSRTFTPDCVDDFAHCPLGVGTNIPLAAVLLGNIQFNQNVTEIEEVFLVLKLVDISTNTFVRTGVSIREYHEPMATDVDGETNSYSPAFAMYGMKRMFEQVPEEVITII